MARQLLNVCLPKRDPKPTYEWFRWVEVAAVLAVEREKRCCVVLWTGLGWVYFPAFGYVCVCICVFSVYVEGVGIKLSLRKGSVDVICLYFACISVFLEKGE